MPRTKQIDTTPFAGVMAEALIAYQLDSGLAVAMCNSAVAIKSKRLSWACRTELRNAEANAVAACRLLPTFTCTNPSPCGTGAGCRWSTGDLALLSVPTKPGKATRPQPHECGSTYDLESAVKALVAMREGSTQLA